MWKQNYDFLDIKYRVTISMIVSCTKYMSKRRRAMQPGWALTVWGTVVMLKSQRDFDETISNTWERLTCIYEIPGCFLCLQTE